jgi:hypothetical protein
MKGALAGPNIHAEPPEAQSYSSKNEPLTKNIPTGGM